MGDVGRISEGGEVLSRVLSGQVGAVEDDELYGLFASGQAAVVFAAVKLAATRLFGSPPDVRAVTRYVLALRQRLTPGDAFRPRVAEAIIRMILGELWLAREIDLEKFGYGESRVLLTVLHDLRLSPDEVADYVQEAEAAAAGLTDTVAALSEEIMAKFEQVRADDSG